MTVGVGGGGTEESTERGRGHAGCWWYTRALVCAPQYTERRGRWSGRSLDLFLIFSVQRNWTRAPPVISGAVNSVDPRLSRRKGISFSSERECLRAFRSSEYTRGACIIVTCYLTLSFHPSVGTILRFRRPCLPWGFVAEGRRSLINLLQVSKHSARSRTATKGGHYRGCRLIIRGYFVSARYIRAYFWADTKAGDVQSTSYPRFFLPIVLVPISFHDGGGLRSTPPSPSSSFLIP